MPGHEHLNDAHEQIVQLELDGPIAIDPADLGQAYGVPEEQLPIIADKINAALEAAGIEPDSVLFAGYNDKGVDPDADKLSRQSGASAARLGGFGLGGSEVEFGDGYGDMGHDDDFMDFDGATEADFMADFGLEGGVAEVPRYDLGDFESFYEPQSAEANPVHYAGTVPSATIGVYDKRAIAALEPTYGLDENQSWVIVNANLEQLQTAMVAEIHPQYTATPE